MKEVPPVTVTTGTTAFPTLRTPSGGVPADAPAWNPQRPSSMPHHRYRPADARVPLPSADRSWPSRRLTRAPLWVPVDLRDGNQALAEPMDAARKRRMFDLLVAMGFKEIEVGYPSASETDFGFVRHLAESGAVPDDVTVSVFTAARSDLIDRTIASVEGLPRTLVHLYTATAPVWRDVVLGRSRAELHAMITDAATHLLRRAGERPGTDIRFEFSPEVFNLTEPDFVLEVCDSLTELWEASPDRPVVHNLPATVEIATPNVYADQIEYMHRHLARRDSVILSVHPHNDRGTGVACAELAVLAGAQRVEGCLFGNGERTGNVDMVTLAMNMYTQGVDPGLDLSDINKIRDVYERCTNMKVGERQPYAGELVFTAFSGSHQDAINKGVQYMRSSQSDLWEIPYLPIDPADVGRQYEPIIRINSQSGKGGAAFIMQQNFGYDLPKAMHTEFGHIVQVETDRVGTELKPQRIFELFQDAYVDISSPYRLIKHAFHEVVEEDGKSCVTFRGTLQHKDTIFEVCGEGNGPINAFFNAIHGQKMDRFTFVDYKEHAIQAGSDSMAVAYIQLRDAMGQNHFGVGVDHNINLAPLRGILSAINRAVVKK